MIPASVRIFVCTRPHDMRCSYDTLALAAQRVLGQDPRSGALFVFTNKRHNRLKVPWWDHKGRRAVDREVHTVAGDRQDGHMLGLHGAMEHHRHRVLPR